MSLLTELSRHWWAWMVPMAWQVSVLALVVWGLTALLRSHSPHLRYWLWMLVLVRLVLPPALALPTGVGNIVESPHPLRPGYGVPYSASTTAALTAPEHSGTPTTTPPAETSPVKVPFYVWLFGLWVAGLLAIAALVGTQVVRIQRRLRSASPLPQLQPLLSDCMARMGVNGPVALVSSAQIQSPILCGLLRPRICLPAGTVDEFDAESIGPVLLHELAHLKRGDMWVNWVQMLLQTVYWYNPFVLLANLKVRSVRELIVDDAVLSVPGAAMHVYGDSLLKVAASAPRKWTVAPGLVGIGEDAAGVQERVKRIADTTRKVHRRLGLLSAVVLIVAGMVLIPQARGKGGLSRMTKNDAGAQYPSEKLLQGVQPVIYHGDARSNRAVLALDNVMQDMGEEPAYDRYLAMSARAFGANWSEDAYYQRESRGVPDWEERLASVRASAEATGYGIAVLGNRDYRAPIQVPAISSMVDNEGIRAEVVQSIGGRGRAVVALMDLASNLDWRILNGYTDNGKAIAAWSGLEKTDSKAVAMGWPGFEAVAEDGFGFQDDGSIRATDWEERVAALVVISGEKEPDDRSQKLKAYRAMLERASTLLRHGAVAFDSSISVLAEDVDDVRDEVLTKRLGFFAMVFLGDMASDRHYASGFLQEIVAESIGLDTAALATAAGDLRKVHDMVWQCWDIAGHHQRKPEEEVQKFRKRENRERIAQILREMRELDLKTAEILAGAADDRSG